MVQKPKAFDKYYYYTAAVQSPASDVVFIRDVYKELTGTTATTLCEDFCGTFAISCEWVKLSPNHKAVGIDLDPEPIAYGKAHYLPQLKPDQQKRIRVLQEDVLGAGLPKVDMIAAMNFSYYLFKSRERILSYFRGCRERLNKNGILLVDCFGGSACQVANEEETVHKTFSYFWDQVSYDPVTNHALFYIHFKLKGQKKIERVFTYDWRMWTIPELREILAEAGFRKTHVYWEGTTKTGEGNGEFLRREKGEECESWVAYIAAEK